MPPYGILVPTFHDAEQPTGKQTAFPRSRLQDLVASQLGEPPVPLSSRDRRRKGPAQEPGLGTPDIGRDSSHLDMADATGQSSVATLTGGVMAPSGNNGAESTDRQTGLTGRDERADRA